MKKQNIKKRLKKQNIKKYFIDAKTLMPFIEETIMVDDKVIATNTIEVKEKKEISKNEYAKAEDVYNKKMEKERKELSKKRVEEYNKKLKKAGFTKEQIKVLNNK